MAHFKTNGSYIDCVVDVKYIQFENNNLTLLRTLCKREAKIIMFLRANMYLERFL